MHILSKIRHCLERREERYPTFEAVEIMTKEGSLIGKATLRDISKSGAFMQTNVMLSYPERIKMRMPRLSQTVDASVEWRTPDEIGIRFEEDVDLATFAMRFEKREERITKYLKPMRSGAA